MCCVLDNMQISTSQKRTEEQFGADKLEFSGQINNLQSLTDIEGASVVIDYVDAKNGPLMWNQLHSFNLTTSMSARAPMMRSLTCTERIMVGLLPEEHTKT